MIMLIFYHQQMLDVHCNDLSWFSYSALCVTGKYNKFIKAAGNYQSRGPSIILLPSFPNCLIVRGKEDVVASGWCFGVHQVWRWWGCNGGAGNESHPSKGQGHVVTITMMHAPLLSTSLHCSVHIENILEIFQTYRKYLDRRENSLWILQLKSDRFNFIELRPARAGDVIFEMKWSKSCSEDELSSCNPHCL